MHPISCKPRCVAKWLLVLLFSLANGQLVHAQSSEVPVIIVMDEQQILRESTAVQELQKHLGGERSAFQSELRTQEQDLRSADQELARQRTVLSAEAFATKRKELERKVAKLQRQVQERKVGLEKIFRDGMAQVRKALIEVAHEIAKERAADLVFTKRAVVLVNPSFDITREALKRLNQKLPTVALAIPQN